MRLNVPPVAIASAEYDSVPAQVFRAPMNGMRLLGLGASAISSPFER